MRARMEECRLACSLDLLRVPRAALVKRSRNGSVDTSDLGIDNPSSVFHSFRHGFKDALRAAGVNEDVNDALTGHSGGNSVARGYGWKVMVRRFGFPTLCAAVEKVCYTGLDLAALHWRPAPGRSNGAPWRKDP